MYTFTAIQDNYFCEIQFEKKSPPSSAENNNFHKEFHLTQNPRLGGVGRGSCMCV